MTPGRTIFGLVLGLALLPCCAEAQNDVFWEARQRQQAGAAAQLILARDPLTALVLRAEGYRWKVWLEPEFIGDAVPELNPEWLEMVRDGTPMPDFRAKADDEKRTDQIAIYEIWTQAVVNAFNTPADAFAKSAEENSHVTFAHLWNTPERYRGKLIPVKGRLARVRKFDATLEAQKQGIRYVYEGWIFGPTKRSHPFVVLFPILPDGLKEAEAMDREVSFSGYFLKKMKYPAGDGSKFLEAPLLVGPTVMLIKEKDHSVPVSLPSFTMTVIVTVVVLILAVSIGLVVIGWYFHRGDQALKKRLAQMQAERTMTFLDHTAPEETDISPLAEPKPLNNPDT